MRRRSTGGHLADERRRGGPVTARLRPMRLADLDAVLELEEQLFAPDTWTRAMYRDELSRTDTRSYLVAEDGDRVVGYAGLIAYDDEAHVATIGVAPDRQGEGIGEVGRARGRERG